MSYESICKLVRKFRDERDWSQFHNPKDLAMSISIEAGELLETFQWSGTDLNGEAVRSKTEAELADVAIYCLYLADSLGVDLLDLIETKVAHNASKYPINKARGSSRKYTEL